MDYKLISTQSIPSKFYIEFILCNGMYNCFVLPSHSHGSLVEFGVLAALTSAILSDAPACERGKITQTSARRWYQLSPPIFF